MTTIVLTAAQLASPPAKYPRCAAAIPPMTSQMASRIAPTLLVLRLQFDNSAGDDGGYVRFSPGTSRLVIAGKQYYPIATLDSGRIAVAHLPDDYLLAGSGVDFIYEVDTDADDHTAPFRNRYPAVHSGCLLDVLIRP